MQLTLARHAISEIRFGPKTQIDGGTLTVDRDSLRAAQTPQGFEAPRLRAAHAITERDATDDASMIEADGGIVVAIPGDPMNLKVTHPLDLVLARALVAERRGAATTAVRD